MYRVLIGSAHTNKEPGSIYNGYREFDIARKILEKTIPYLEKSKIEFNVVPIDLELISRIDWINKTGYSEKNNDIFVEIHINDGGKRGIEGWFRGNSTETNKSQRLAEFLVNSMCTKLKFENQGVCCEYDQPHGGLLILNQTNTISALIEILYIDNEEDLKILIDDTQLDLIGKNLSLSIEEYLEDVKKNPNTKNKVIPRKTKDKYYEDFLLDVDNEYNQENTQIENSKTDANLQPTQQISANNYNTNTATYKTNTNSGGTSVNNQTINDYNAQNQASHQHSNKLLTREERKALIEKVYKIVLGREPTQKECDDNLRTSIEEFDLIKKLIESEEHKNIINESKEYKKLTEEVKTITEEKLRIEKELKESQKMIIALEKVNTLKNKALRKLQKAFVESNIIKKGSYFDHSKDINLDTIKETSNFVTLHKYKRRNFIKYIIQLLRL